MKEYNKHEKIIIIATTTILAMMMIPSLAKAQVQTPGYQCSQCPQGQQLIPIPQQQFVQQPVLTPPPSITIENITTAITNALDPINKHLAVQDSEIANITTIITKLQQAPAPQPLPAPPTNSTSLPPPPPPGQGDQQPQSGSACPNSGGGPFGGGPINQYFGYPGGYGPHFGNFGGHHGGSRGGR